MFVYIHHHYVIIRSWFINMNLSLPSMAAKYICMQTYTILYSVVNSVQLDTEKLQLVCIATLSY